MTDKFVESGRDGPPLASSICVPLHNCTSVLVREIASFAELALRNVDVCVSDDGSTDCRETQVRAATRANRQTFVYSRSRVDLRYGPNTRASIGLTRGGYSRPIANDDALCGPDAPARLGADLAAYSFLGVAISDFWDVQTGAVAGGNESNAGVEGHHLLCSVPGPEMPGIESPPAEVLASGRPMAAVGGLT